MGTSHVFFSVFHPFLQRRTTFVTSCLLPWMTKTFKIKGNRPSVTRHLKLTQTEAFKQFHGNCMFHPFLQRRTTFVTSCLLPWMTKTFKIKGNRPSVTRHLKLTQTEAFKQFHGNCMFHPFLQRRTTFVTSCLLPWMTKTFKIKGNRPSVTRHLKLTQTEAFKQFHGNCMTKKQTICVRDCMAKKKHNMCQSSRSDGVFDDKFFYFSSKPYVVTPHLNRLVKLVPMRGHNICFYTELTKIIPYYYQILCLI